MYRDKKLYRDKVLISIQVQYMRQVSIARQVRLDISLICGISALSETMSEEEATLFSLLLERAARLNEPPNVLESEEDEHNYEEISCERMLERFGEDYVKELTGFTDAQVMEILETCGETLKPVGPGRHYRDMESGLIIYLVWLTSCWTVKKIGSLFDIAKATAQRTLTYVMSGLTESLKLAYLPKSIRDINISSQFKNFPQAIGAVDATLILVQKPSDRENEGQYYSGKHHAHGAKVQVVVSSDGFAIHASKVIPGRRHDAFLFRISGVDSFMKDNTKIGGTTRIVQDQDNEIEMKQRSRSMKSIEIDSKLNCEVQKPHSALPSPRLKEATHPTDKEASISVRWN